MGKQKNTRSYREKKKLAQRRQREEARKAKVPQRGLNNVNDSHSIVEERDSVTKTSGNYEFELFNKDVSWPAGNATVTQESKNIVNDSTSGNVAESDSATERTARNSECEYVNKDLLGIVGNATVTQDNVINESDSKNVGETDSVIRAFRGKRKLAASMWRKEPRNATVTRESANNSSYSDVGKHDSVTKRTANNSSFEHLDTEVTNSQMHDHDLSISITNCGENSGFNNSSNIKDLLSISNNGETNFCVEGKSKAFQLQKQEWLQNPAKRKHPDQGVNMNNDIQGESKVAKLEKRRVQYRQKYQEDAKFRAKKREEVRKRYRANAEYRRYVQQNSLKQYREDESCKGKKKQASVVKYKDNAEHRAKVKQASVNRYKDNAEHRVKVKQASVSRYKDNAEHRVKVKQASVIKYKTNAEHRMKVKQASLVKYNDISDTTYREAKKQKSKQKYRDNVKHQEAVKRFNKEKYASNQQFREKIKKLKRLKYSRNESHRKNILFNKRRHYASDFTIRQRKIQSVEQARHLSKNEETDIVASFRREISKKPTYICCVCHKFLWKEQCIICKPEQYSEKASDSGDMAVKCISTKYLHSCLEDCEEICEVASSSRGSLWICYTCHRKLLQGQMPPEAQCNNLELTPIPQELNNLNDLETHLLSLRIPFMKMVALPKGGQKGVTGPCVSVPSDIQETTKVLPRTDIDTQLIRVKLKRKLPYKGHYKYQFVDTKRMKKAFDYLQQNNQWYKDVTLDPTWQTPAELMEQSNEDSQDDKQDDDDHDHDDHDETVSSNQDNENDNGKTTDAERMNGAPVDTCLQPVDIGQEVLDQHFDELFCVAPAANNTPVSMLKETGNEAMSFPSLYPTGCTSFNDERPVRLAPLRYFHNRLMNVDSRFAKDTTYIFYAQYLCELYQVISNVSIALRKGTALDQEGKTVTSQMITDNNHLKQILQNDQGYKFLKPVRGTPPYWQATMKDLFAMIRQKGIPTWFCTFSAADMRWPEIMKTISEQQGSYTNVDELDWKEKCDLLSSNPVMNALMFNHRFNAFMKCVLLSDLHPIGHIDTRFHRIEFQQRGSPHTHCTFWVEDSPKLDEDDDETVCDFIDSYVTCHQPSEDEDPELHEIVGSVQQHSKSHSKSCKKKGTECRFNFPRPVSQRTFISRPQSLTEPSSQKSPEQMINEAKLILQTLWNVILDPDLDATEITTEALFQKAGITQEQYEDASNVVTKKTSVVLQRSPGDVWINQYQMLER